jgi:hypothetical protein
MKQIVLLRGPLPPLFFAAARERMGRGMREKGKSLSTYLLKKTPLFSVFCLFMRGYLFLLRGIRIAKDFS